MVCSPSHLDSSSEVGLSLGGYFCPQCHAKHTELPVECKICGTYACMVMFEREYKYLTIIPPGRMGYGVIGHEAERDHCFSKIQLVGQ